MRFLDEQVLTTHYRNVEVAKAEKRSKLMYLIMAALIATALFMVRK